MKQGWFAHLVRGESDWRLLRQFNTGRHLQLLLRIACCGYSRLAVSNAYISVLFSFSWSGVMNRA